MRFSIESTCHGLLISRKPCYDNDVLSSSYQHRVNVCIGDSSFNTPPHLDGATRGDNWQLTREAASSTSSRDWIWSVSRTISNQSIIRDHKIAPRNAEHSHGRRQRDTDHRLWRPDSSVLRASPRPRAITARKLSWNDRSDTAHWHGIWPTTLHCRSIRPSRRLHEEQGLGREDSSSRRWSTALSGLSNNDDNVARFWRRALQMEKQNWVTTKVICGIRS